MKDYGKVIELDPNYGDGYYGRGLVKAELGDYREAIKRLR